MADCRKEAAAPSSNYMSTENGKVRLDFDEFYCLMKLKIGYQRKKVSQVMMKESEKLGYPYGADSRSNDISSLGPDGVPSVRNSEKGDRVQSIRKANK